MVDVPSVSLQIAGHHTREGTKAAGGDALPFITTRPSGPLALCVRRRCNYKGCVALEGVRISSTTTRGRHMTTIAARTDYSEMRSPNGTTDGPSGRMPLFSFQSPTACLGRNGRSSRGIHAPIGPGVFTTLHLPVPQACSLWLVCESEDARVAWTGQIIGYLPPCQPSDGTIRRLHGGRSYEECTTGARAMESGVGAVPPRSPIGVNMDQAHPSSIPAPP